MKQMNCRRPETFSLCSSTLCAEVGNHNFLSDHLYCNSKFNKSLSATAAVYSMFRVKNYSS